ncbi:MAG TPA: hypothetical protein VF384_01815 [Planctomycetota bacterium]
MRSPRPFVLWAALAALPAVAQEDPAALVALLGSADAQTRVDAYNKLMRVRSVELMAQLAKVLPQLPLHGASLAVYLLDAYPWEASAPLWKKLAGQGSAFVRATAAAAQWRRGDKSQGAALAAAIAAASPEERTYVLGRLHGIDDQAVVAAVRGYVRPGAIDAVIGQALDLLVQSQKGRDAETIAAAEALIGAGGETEAIARAYLVAAGEGARHAAALAALLRDLPQLYQVTRFLERASRLEPVLIDAIAARLAAARTEYDLGRLVPLLQKHAPGQIEQALKHQLDNGDDKLRSAALKALAAVPGALDAKKLQEMLAADDPLLVLAAADTLRRMDDPAGIERVIGLTRKAGKHRPEAVRVLGGFRDARAVPPLLDAFADGDVQVRRAAVTGLQTILPDLFPYRRFDLERAGLRADAADAQRAEGLRLVRAWWDARK